MNFNKKDAVADAVDSVLQQEALKGNQNKIDKNHNNRIDAGDFKILRGEKKEKKVSEEIDVNDTSVDDLSGQKKIKRKDDVGPSGNFKSSKVRFHAGPKNESLEEPLEKVLADTAPHSGVIKTVMATDELNDANKSLENKTKLKMKEGFTLKSFKEKFEDYSIVDQMINEVLSKDASAGDWIHDFVHSDNPKFAGKSKEMRKKMALAAYYAKQRNEEVEQVTEMDKSQTPPGRDGASTDPNAGPQGTAKAVSAKSFMKKAGSVLHKALTGGSDKDQLDRLRKDMYKKEEVEQIDEAEMKTKTAYVPYVYTDSHGSGFGGYDVHYSKEADAHAHLERHGHIDRGGKKGWVEKHELAKHPHTGSWVEANHLRRHGLAEETEQVEEGWDDMLKSVKDRAGPQPSGGAGVKKGRAYGGAAQKSKPEQEEEPKKKVNEAKRPEDDSVPFAPPYNTTSAPVTDKSGATHTPMSRAKHLARLAMKRVKKDLGKK